MWYTPEIELLGPPVGVKVERFLAYDVLDKFLKANALLDIDLIRTLYLAYV